MYLAIFYRKYSFKCVVLLLLTQLTFIVALRPRMYIKHNKANNRLRSKLDYAALSSRNKTNFNKLTNSLNMFGPQTVFTATINPPGVILRTKGGIGNQLFQYACSYALAKDLGWPLYYNVDSSTSLNPRGFQPHQREFALDQFHVSLENVINKTMRLSKEVTYLNDLEFLERTFLNGTDAGKRFIQLSGSSYCQSIEYWRNYQDDSRAMFTPKQQSIDFPKIQKIISKIKSSGESVVVHVRRGDYLGTKHYVPMSYQRRAIRKIINILNERGKEKPVFFVFSDDIAYTRKKLKDFDGNFEMVFVSQEIANSTSIEEFYLMTLCKHIILPASTFSWWAAYLMGNPEKIVIASAFNPKFFQPASYDDVVVYGKNFHPKVWIVIDPFTGGLVNNV